MSASFDLSNPKTYHSVVNGYVITNNLGNAPGSHRRAYYVFGDYIPYGPFRIVESAVDCARTRPVFGGHEIVVEKYEPDFDETEEEPVPVVEEETDYEHLPMTAEESSETLEETTDHSATETPDTETGDEWVDPEAAEDDIYE
jgi:hypothetical protein